MTAPLTDKEIRDILAKSQLRCPCCEAALNATASELESEQDLRTLRHMLARGAIRLASVEDVEHLARQMRDADELDTEAIRRSYTGAE